MAEWIFQYGVASLGLIGQNCTFAQTFNVARTAVPRQSGIIIPPPTKGERRIRISGSLNQGNQTDARDAVNSLQNVLFNNGDREKLNIHDDRHIECYLTGFTHGWLPGVAGNAMSIQIDFTATHPFFIDNSSFSSTENVTTGSDEFSLVNTGTALTPPEIKFVATNSNFAQVALTNATTSETISITRTTSVGDEISVNVASFTVVDSAGVDLMGSVAGTFPEMMTGTNSYSFTGSACDIVTTWNPRYDQ